MKLDDISETLLMNVNAQVCMSHATQRLSGMVFVFMKHNQGNVSHEISFFRNG